MKLRVAAALILAVAGMALWVVNCSGPRPEVVGKRLIEPPGLNESYRAEADIRNSGWGHGQVRVQFLIRDTSEGRSYSAEQKVELESDEEILATAEIPAPPGTYELQVKVSYPP